MFKTLVIRTRHFCCKILACSIFCLFKHAACTCFYLFRRRVFKFLPIQTCCVFKFLPIWTPRVQVFIYSNTLRVQVFAYSDAACSNLCLFGHGINHSTRWYSACSIKYRFIWTICIYIVLLNDFKIYEQVHMHKWKSSLQSPQVEIWSAISPHWPGEINLRWWTGDMELRGTDESAISRYRLVEIELRGTDASASSQSSWAIARLDSRPPLIGTDDDSNFYLRSFHPINKVLLFIYVYNLVERLQVWNNCIKQSLAARPILTKLVFFNCPHNCNERPIQEG